MSGRAGRTGQSSVFSRAFAFRFRFARSCRAVLRGGSRTAGSPIRGVRHRSGISSSPRSCNRSSWCRERIGDREGARELHGPACRPDGRLGCKDRGAQAWEADSDLQARSPHGGTRHDPRQREARSPARGDQHPSPTAAKIEGEAVAPSRWLERNSKNVVRSLMQQGSTSTWLLLLSPCLSDR